MAGSRCAPLCVAALACFCGAASARKVPFSLRLTPERSATALQARAHTGSPSVPPPSQSPRAPDDSHLQHHLCRLQVKEHCPCDIVLWNARLCVGFMSHMAGLPEGVVDTAYVQGDISTDCLRYETVCNVTHSVHGRQLLNDTYDFGNLCAGQMQFAYVYNIAVQGNSSSSDRRAEALITDSSRRSSSRRTTLVRHKTRTRVMSVTSISGERYQEWLTVQMQDRVPFGGITPAFSANFQLDVVEGSRTSSRLGEWMQITYRPEIARCTPAGDCTGIDCLGGPLSALMVLVLFFSGTAAVTAGASWRRAKALQGAPAQHAPPAT
eukprot:TRINITY_DN34820_c0_g1_i1.p1 TRINITY_DN34820_c0_g1~~TRINITY_DN34820_c0_g1_i1.p1  ORF type:complete len:359 (+),score=69.36 TRINITY_DN34820_c0_g1_i1:109-1077(+)